MHCRKHSFLYYHVKQLAKGYISHSPANIEMLHWDLTDTNNRWSMQKGGKESKKRKVQEGGKHHRGLRVGEVMEEGGDRKEGGGGREEEGGREVYQNYVLSAHPPSFC